MQSPPCDRFSLLSDDTLIDILSRLISDPRDWSRLSCVSPRFSVLIRSSLSPSWCSLFLPNLSLSLSPLPSSFPSLRKLSLCCPGPLHARLPPTPNPNPHLSPRPFSREEGTKLLASRFRSDCLYITQWPGCVHHDPTRNYFLFRGVFKAFKDTSVWRALRDAHRSRIQGRCAFCDGRDTWDLHSAFCLRRGLDFHQGEPVVRAFVCQNGHVAGAWVEKPMYL